MKLVRGLDFNSVGTSTAVRHKILSRSSFASSCVKINKLHYRNSLAFSHRQMELESKKKQGKKKGASGSPSSSPESALNPRTGVEETSHPVTDESRSSTLRHSNL